MSLARVASPENIAPGPLEPTESFRFDARDGSGLYGEWFTPPEPRATALLLHGYAEHCGRYRELAHVLVQTGFAVLSYDMRGHGRADGQRGHIDDFTDYLDDMDAALHELDQRSGNASSDHALPTLFIGHSNGALVLLRALCDPLRKPDHVAAAVLSSPFLRLRAELPLAKRLLGRTAGRWLPRLSLPHGIDIDHLTSDPTKQAERRMDTLCHEVASARWFTAALEAQEYVADYASRIDVPTQWLVSHRDHLADPAASRVVHARLRAPSVYHGFEDMQHEVFNERERGRVFALLQGFVKDILCLD